MSELRKCRICGQRKPAAEFISKFSKMPVNYFDCQACRNGGDIFAAAAESFEIPDSYKPNPA